MDESHDRNESLTSITRGFNDSNSLRIRLDTDSLLERYELLLKGITLSHEYDEKSGLYIPKQISYGLPSANPAGIQKIFHWLSSILNPQVVQGNFMVDERGYSQAFEDYMEWLRKILGIIYLTIYINLRSKSLR
jgi:hypothetical protein